MSCAVVDVLRRDANCLCHLEFELEFVGFVTKLHRPGKTLAITLRLGPSELHCALVETTITLESRHHSAL